MTIRQRLVPALMAATVVTGVFGLIGDYAAARGPDTMVAGLPGLHRMGDALQLTDAQRESIRQVMQDARAAARSQPRPSAAELQALVIPTDPNHANALEAAKQRAVARVQNRADVGARIYALLTPEQQSKLPQLLAATPAWRE